MNPSRTFLERAVCVLALEALDRPVLAPITSAWFTDGIATRAWEWISRQRLAQATPDLAQLLGELDPEDGATLMEDVPTIFSHGHSIETAARELALAVDRDWLRTACSTAVRTAATDVEGARATLADALTRRPGLTTAPVTVTALDAVMAFTADVEARVQGTAPPPLLYGYPAMDALTLGLDAGQLVLIAARATIGKSLLAMNLTRHWCRDRHKVLYISLEMRAKKCTARWLAMLSGLNAQFLERGVIRASEDWSRLSLAIGQYGDWPLWLHTDPLDVGGLVALVRETHAREGIEVVVVDYAGLLENAPAYRGETNAAQVGRVARTLKNLATACDIPVVSLVQLNRKSEDRPDRMPVLSDLRDSGDWEAHADVVWLGHRLPQDKDHLTVILAKNRDGEANEILDLAWEPVCMRLLPRVRQEAAS